ncbi:deoxyribodipyrimidine photo-lyase [Tenacibaculum sp. IB213877]|uniref:cryptochrome/photolyase family protein n=1 Tax=Tenacibaculum sp. IB213877 TaxID=3097351 RepID=UPI002A5A5C2B|nr:deoxyribodipyrimidine photo-lyase [Tenacibaculum sp. IB213877]MDY0781416.1 deoxyribodipyrimidine photo-lyase [Tenacibaculum sp. IB213877]
MMDSISIFWFRRDLRLEDNHGLFKALQSDSKILPIFIFDKNILEQLPKNDARVGFIHQQLLKINSVLLKHNSGLTTHHGTPKEVFQTLTKKFKINAVYTNKDYEPYAYKRDKEIENFLNSQSIEFYSYKDQVIFEKKEVVKDDGTPYRVYTPYSKKWLSIFNKQKPTFYSSENLLKNLALVEKPQLLSLEEIGFQESNIKIPNFNINSHLIENYEETRDFPAINGTSHIGPHLRFGTISVRKAVDNAQKSKNNTFLKELIWREFFMQILWHFPKTVTEAFKPEYDHIKWRNNEKEFEKWKHGKTGYPLVDAGMRQLNSTGYMHNRVRMLVGSFLCKHLLIDWRWGEAYFAEKLLDFELASNIGNWQWVAGSGVDAAPYFRIFNPTTQIKKFDKDLQYIKKWVPEFQELTYPEPMVDHSFARERCLSTYKKALNNS